MDFVGEEAPGPVEMVTRPDMYPPEAIEDVVREDGPPKPAIEVA